MQGTTTDLALANYIDILEKTNQQLSLWYNPYGIMVGALSILIALAAIGFAYFLWIQSRDYKRAFKEFLDGQRKIADNELVKSLTEIRESFETTIKTYEDGLKDLKGETRIKIQNELTSIKKLKKKFEQSSTVIRSGGVDGNLVSGSWLINKTIGTPTISIANPPLTGHAIADGLYNDSILNSSGFVVHMCKNCVNSYFIGEKCPVCGAHYNI